MRNRNSWAFALLLVMPGLAPAAEEKASASDKTVCADTFKDVDIRELIEKVAKRTGKQFVIDPRVRAGIPLVGLTENDVDYARLLAILTLHQFVAYESGGVVKVTVDAVSRQLPIPVTSEVPPKALDDELVSLVIQVKSACAAHLVPIVRPLMPQSAHLAAMSPNALVIVDRAANARRVVEVIERLDKAAPTGQKCPAETGWTPAKAEKPEKK
ncbi:MAG TPA: hypothetical protein VIV63_11480 [Steroidobacteraceae bacterium]